MLCSKFIDHNITHFHSDQQTADGEFYLIRENIFNLSELLVESGGVGNRGDILWLIVHLTVPVD